MKHYKVKTKIAQLIQHLGSKKAAAEALETTVRMIDYYLEGRTTTYARMKLIESLLPKRDGGIGN